MMKIIRSKSIVFSVLFLFLFILGFPSGAFAQTNGWCQITTGVSVPCPVTGGGPAGMGENATASSVILFVIGTALMIVGSLAVLALIWGGFRYITAFGNEDQAESAKHVIKTSVLGLIIVLLSFALVTLITNFLISGFV